MTERRYRALVVACNFPPDASVGTMRTLRLVRHLTTADWNVDVVTVSPDGFRSGTVVDAALRDRVPPGTHVMRAMPLRPFERLASLLKRAGATKSRRDPHPDGAQPGAVKSTAPPTGLSRARKALSAALALPDRENSWLLPAIWQGCRGCRNAPPDVVYSSGPPFTAHLAGFALARLFRRPWVADFRDPWARAPWREDRFEFERRAWGVFERWVVRSAQAVVFVTDTNRRDFIRQYPAEATRFFLVPNGCDSNDFAGLAPRPQRDSDRFVLLHAGSLYGARNPASLLRAVASASAKGSIDGSRFTLRFIGRLGLQGVDLPGVARSLGLEPIVEFASHLPRRDCLQEMLDASALLIVQPVTTVSIPAKLYEYMAAGRPILALAEPGGETSELINRSRAGVAVLADDEAAIEEALVSIVQLARSGFAPVDPGTYDGEVRAAELRHILSAVIERQASRSVDAQASSTADTRQ